MSQRNGLELNAEAQRQNSEMQWLMRAGETEAKRRRQK